MPLSNVSNIVQYAVASKSAKEMEFFDRTGYTVSPMDADGECLFSSADKAVALRQHLINTDKGDADDLMVVCHQTTFLTSEYREK